MFILCSNPHNMKADQFSPKKTATNEGCKVCPVFNTLQEEIAEYKKAKKDYLQAAELYHKQLIELQHKLKEKMVLSLTDLHNIAAN